jgi:hypothetical protein
MFGDEMIDEASHKMAQAIVARGRASGLGQNGLGQDGGLGRDMGGPGRDMGGPGRDKGGPGNS